MPYNSFDDYPMSWRPVLKKEKGTPLYLTLASKLENDIASGILKSGTKLPPQRELADFLDINLSTVARAFKICSDKGLLNGSVGSGTFVSYHMVNKMVPAEKNIIDLGGIMPAEESSEEMRALISAMMRDSDFGDMMQYLSGTEYWQNQAGARLLERVGCHINTSDVLISGGGQNALASVLLSVFKPGDRLGCDPLVYPGVISLASMLGIRLIPIRQENGEMTEEGIEYAVKNDGIKGLYIIPEYQNPTMHRMSKECRVTVSRLAKKHDLIIIEDGFSSLLTRDIIPPVYSMAPEHTVFFLSLSKSIGPALRQAYIAAAPKYRGAVETALYNMNMEPSNFLSELAARLVLSGKYEALLERRLALIRERNIIAENILGDYKMAGDGRSLCKWLFLPDKMTGTEFEKSALEHNVLLYGSEHFAVGRSTPAPGARLSICTPKTAAELERALTILRDILKSAE